MLNPTRPISWRTILSYKVEKKFESGAAVALKGLKNFMGFRNGETGYIVERYTQTIDPAWTVAMDNGKLDEMDTNPAFYERNLELI